MFEWFSVVKEILTAIRIESGVFRWVYFPFSGGLYDQDYINSLTWEVWQFTKDCYLSELKLKEEMNEQRNENKD